MLINLQTQLKMKILKLLYGFVDRIQLFLKQTRKLNLLSGNYIIVPIRNNFSLEILN